MTTIIKEFKRFPTGSWALDLNKLIETEEEEEQFERELNSCHGMKTR